MRYVDVLSHGRLPGPDESTEFFAAPLPYALPALLYAVGTDRWGVVVKAAQLQNVAWSIGLTLALWTLLLLGTLPVYYKTFAFVRGEPLAAFLAVVAVERSLSIWASQGARRGQWLGLGATLGLLMLAKQWGAFVVVAVALFTCWCALAYSRSSCC